MCVIAMLIITRVIIVAEMLVAWTFFVELVAIAMAEPFLEL